MPTIANRVLMLALLAASPLSHAEIYKCTAPDGKTLYQQVPCSGAAAESRVKVHRGPSAAEAARTRATIRATQRSQAEADYERALNSSYEDTGSYEESVGYDEPAAADGPTEASGGHCPPGTRAMNASKSDPSRGFSQGKGYVRLQCVSTTPRARADEPDPPRTGPGYTTPRRFVDQNGDWYEQPPGSNFARQERTGRQCVMNGSVVVNCN